MSKNKSKKKVMYAKREEKRAQKVIKIIFGSLVVLALVLLVAFSYFN